MLRAISAGVVLIGLASAAQAQDACHTADHLLSDIFGGKNAVGYSFMGHEATALEISLSVSVSHSFVMDAANIIAVDDVTDSTVAFYLYGSDGCFFWFVSGALSQAADIFDRAGLAAPFGETFYGPGSINL